MPERWIAWCRRLAPELVAVGGGAGLAAGYLAASQFLESVIWNR